MGWLLLSRLVTPEGCKKLEAQTGPRTSIASTRGTGNRRPSITHTSIILYVVVAIPRKRDEDSRIMLHTQAATSMTDAEFLTVLKAARQPGRSRTNALRTRRSRPRVANLLCLVLPILLWGTRASAQEPAQQPANGDEQANALLARMTLEEKIGQMTQVDSLAIKDMADIQRYFIGSVLSGGSSDPSPDKSPGRWLECSQQRQLFAVKTRVYKTPN